MKEYVERILRQVMEAGLQVHPSLLKLLESSDIHQLIRYSHLIKAVIREKKMTRDEQLVLTADDIIKYTRMEEKEPVNVRFNVIYDVSHSLNPLEDYSDLFLDRYKKMLDLWYSRPISKRVSDIKFVIRSRISKPRRIAGLVTKKITKEGRFIIGVEDPTGRIDVEIPYDLLSKMENILLDSFVIMDVERGGRGFMAKDFWCLDIPSKEMKRIKDELYVAVTSDLHLGKEGFVEDLFSDMIEWFVKMDDRTSKRVCCLIINGDVVDIYAHEKGEVKASYLKLLTYLKQLPDSIIKVIIPGECDATRPALPQPSIFSSYIEQIPIPNLYLLGNPSMISINTIKFLLFHGQSLVDVSSQIPSIDKRNVAKLGRILLKLRHLAPTYGGDTPIAPEKEDLLVIKEVPDVFILGHMHMGSEDFYKNTIILSLPSWLKDDEAWPGRLALINLSTMEIDWKFLE